MSARPAVLRDDPWAQRLLREMGSLPGSCWEWIETRGKVLKVDPYSGVALLELEGESCFVKLYRSRSWLHGRILRSGAGRPRRSQDAARNLLRAAVRVPKPRGCLWVGESVLTLAQGLAGAVELQLSWSAAPASPVRGELMMAAAESLARLHGSGFSHGDCKWNNLLWYEGGVYLVDLDAVRSSPPGSRRLARDLARFTLNAEELAVAPEDYEVFLTAYFSSLGIPREKTLAHMLPELQKLRSRHRHRYGEIGRPLW